MSINVYLRPDGSKGIRNTIVVGYLVECAHHVSREIVYPYREQGVHLIGFPGCFPNPYSYKIMERLCTHPNVDAVLLVPLGCEGFNKGKLLESIRQSGRPAKLVIIQDTGGTRKSVTEGKAWVEQTLKQLENTPRAPMAIDELVVGTICGGSDATSGFTANPAMGRAFDFMVDQNATCLFEETGELIGMEHWMAKRAENPALGEEIVKTVAKAAKYYAAYGHASLGPGNADGGLTTIEEKSLGAYAVGPIGYLRHHQAGRCTHARRFLLAGRRAGWRAALRFSQHQRQRRNRRTHGVRLAPEFVLDGARLGGGIGHRPGDQGVREPGNL